MIKRMKKILIVDDEASIHYLYCGELEEEGFEVFSAYSGEECLQKLLVIQYDLIILDINMPGMGGINALRKIKAIKSELPVILCSAYPEYKEDLGAWTSDDYIVKSADTEELLNSINKLLKD